MATLASGLTSPADYDDPNVVKVVTGGDDCAIYFSRAPIPYCRDENARKTPQSTALRHHGIYAYRRDVLNRIVHEPAPAIEQCEKLEQLRALWLGVKIRVGRAVVAPGPGVDTEDDLARAEVRLRQAARSASSADKYS